MLAADKGALCLTMSALDTLPESEFANMMPGLLAIFSFEGWMVVVWGLLLMPIGVAIQTIAMLKTKGSAALAGRALPLQPVLRGFPGRSRDHQFERRSVDGRGAPPVRRTPHHNGAREKRLKETGRLRGRTQHNCVQVLSCLPHDYAFCCEVEGRPKADRRARQQQCEVGLPLPLTEATTLKSATGV